MGLLNNLKPRMKSFYEEQKFIQKVGELDGILKLVADKFTTKMKALLDLKNEFYDQCDNRDIAQAERLLIQIKEKIRVYDNNYKQLGLNASSLIDIANLEQHLKDKALSTFSNFDHPSQDQITDDELRVFVQRHSGLTSVRLSSCKNMTDAGLLALSQGCPGLTSVQLEYCGNFTDAGLLALSRGCPGLTSVDLTHCKNITDASLQALSIYCKNLHTLSVHACNFTDAGLKFLSAGCHNLSILRLPGIDEDRHAKITDAGLQVLSIGCNRLQELDLGCNGYSGITDVGLQAISRMSSDLATLDLFNCHYITEKGIVSLSAGCPSLVTLSISCTVTEVGLRALSEGCPILKSLSISSGTGVTDAGLQIISTFRHLTYLHTRESPMTDVGLQALSRGCTNLQDLDLWSCHRISTVGLLALGRGCSKLTRLYLSGCNQLTNNAIPALRSRYPNIKESTSGILYATRDDASG